MKYNSRVIAMTDKERQHWNETIIAAIEQTDTENYPFTPEEVYNRFSGKGGLHGLDRNDFENYYAYSFAKKELEQGQFFTPHNLCSDIVRAIQPPDDFFIADLTCGMGNFFNHLPNEENIYGNELEDTAYKVCRLLYPKAHLENRDFLYYDPKVKLDLIIGNPPFNLQTGEGLSQWVYIQKAIELLQYGGLLAIIIPDSFLKDTFSEGHKINWINKHFNFIVQCKIPDNSFDANIDTKLLVLQKKGVTDTYTTYQPENYIPFEPEQIYTNIIAPIYEQYKKDTAKRYLLTVQNGIDNADLRYEIKKCLWHIKSNPVLNKLYYQKALEKIELLTTQQQPYGMKDKEWEHTQLTAEKVYHYLQSILKNQNKKEPVKKMRIVKTCYGLKLKAYVRKLENKGWEKSVHDLLLNGERFKPFKKLYDRKRKELDIQNTPFALLQRDEKIDSFLATFKLIHQRPTPTGLFFEQFKAPTICLNDMQKQDIGLLLQKRFSILSWEQGGGKSVAGMTWMKFLEGKYNNCFLLAPALALNTTWKERLYTYGYNYILIESISDIYKIKKGQIVLISYDRLVTLQRHIKKHVKIQGYKIALLVDESDELTNASSKRSKAALNCFRKAKYKLLTTGTTTRNNINEIYTQMELIYNNSTAFICWAEKVYRVNKNNEVEEEQNGRVGYPFPAFRGAGLFKSCFCPQKSTVLGIKKDTQDIYNSDVLKDLINKTVITRKFEEIVGEKKYSIHTHSIKQSKQEQQLYQTLLTEFMNVCYDFYTSTGNARKEAALRLLRQIKALIKATSVPHLMPHYERIKTETEQELPNKYNKIFELVTEWSKEMITIGTIFKSSANDYYNQLLKKFPQRKILYIDGEMGIESRKKVLEQLKYSRNGILVCTQQSLKSSVNIPYCNKCIIESLQWNIPKISQFYFRFIRFDSVKHTEVHFVNYENTIELNLLALLMSKEKLNDFIKTTNVATTESVYEEFGVDLNILDMLIEKSYDREGKLTLNWGRQMMYK